MTALVVSAHHHTATQFSRQTVRMARKQHLPDTLSPAQVIALQDALLANANRLLEAARRSVEAEDLPLARSLAILGMEESGKAIALHGRRVNMTRAPEGKAFVNDELKELWARHTLKLEAVHAFLVAEEYWFGAGPSDPVEIELALGAIADWKQRHNEIKQRGFYVDVSEGGDPISPDETANADAVQAVIRQVHQIGWQLRLGEHIEGKKQLESSQDVPPASEEEVENMRRLMRRVEPKVVEKIIATMRQGTKGTKLANSEYAFMLPTNPFENVGRPGYEAHDRELAALAEDLAADEDSDKG